VALDERERKAAPSRSLTALRRAAKVCGARDVEELTRGLVAFNLAMFDGRSIARRDAFLFRRTSELASLADHRVNGYICPVHWGPCQCGGTEPDQDWLDELDLTENNVTVAEELLPVLKGLLRDARQEANRQTGGRLNRRHRRALRRDTRQFRMPWVGPVRRHGRSQTRQRCRGYRRVVSRSAGGGGSGDPPGESDSSEPAFSRLPGPKAPPSGEPFARLTL
jgi:hypothetical protein